LGEKRDENLDSLAKTFSFLKNVLLLLFKSFRFISLLAFVNLDRFLALLNGQSFDVTFYSVLKIALSCDLEYMHFFVY
jgi:hypothetical protein